MENNKLYDEAEFIVNKTNDYNKFKNLGYNRDISKTNYRKLKLAIERNPLISIIIVNENFEIIDGQHRFKIMQELGLPIYYVVIPNYGIKEIMILNATSTIWKNTDYIESYAKQGNNNYIKFLDFKENNNDFTEISLNLIIRDCTRDTKNYSKNGVKIGLSPFKDGDFEFNSYILAQERADSIRLFKPYFAKYYTPKFVAAIIFLLKNPNFDIKVMLNKLALQPSSLTLCANQTQYIELLEKIYNYKSKNPISLKYGAK